MSFLKNRSGRWAVPVALSAILVVALFISPALGGPSVLTGKKVVKTITKKTNASQFVSPTAKTLGASEQVLASLDLNAGNYLVSSSFDVRRNAENATVNCFLRITGVSQDAYSSFHSGGGALSMEEGAAMETAGKVGSNTTAQLLCSSGGAASVKNVEITALKVPKLTVTRG